MTRSLHFTFGVLLAAGAASRADDPKPGGKAFDDAAFVAKAASGGLHEVELGRLAATRAKDEKVKAFGQMMVDDHAKANEDLKRSAAAIGAKIPDAMSAEHQKEFDKFKDLQGEAFDRAYIKHMVKDHEADVAEFTRASREARNPALRGFALRTLPVLQKHLEKAKELDTRK